MINFIYTALGISLVSVASFIGAVGVWLNPDAAPVQEVDPYQVREQVDERLQEHFDNGTLGVALPSGTALFETALQERLDRTSTTSMELVSNTVRGGSSLSGYQCFTLDEGRVDTEFICGTVNGTTVTNLERGLDFSEGITSSTTRQFPHRVGANVKITDYPLIQRLKSQNDGSGTFENIISYASGVTPISGSHITDKEYVDGLAFSGAGVIQATTTDDGVVEIATALEAASSTQYGNSSATLVLPASIATSTPPTSGHVIPVTQTVDGNLPEGFIPTTLAQNYTFSGTTTFNTLVTGHASTTFTVYNASTTWNKPLGLERIEVWVCAGGGAGATGSGGSGSGAGGGAGGCAFEVLDANELSATSTVTVAVGLAGQSSSFSSFLSATAGSNGGTGASDRGGVGGVGTGGDLNLSGQGGGGSGQGSGGSMGGGVGGSSHYGGGGYGGGHSGTAGDNGGAGASCGGGGGGGGAGPNSAGSGGAGGAGCIIIKEFF